MQFYFLQFQHHRLLRESFANSVMAIAATSCCFSSLSSSFTPRFSLSSSHRGFATSDVSICFVAPKASSNNNNHNLRSSPSSFESSREVRKEAVSQNKFLGRSKDEGRHSNFDGNSSRGEKRRSQSTAIKSPVKQKKDKKDYMAKMKEQQIGQGNTQGAAFLNAVVKVHCIHTEPDYSLPWQKQIQYTSTSSAFMIEDGILITNAHCVNHATQVKVKRRGDDTKYVAKVLAIGFDCDLALLSVESGDFRKGSEPLKFGHLPCLQDSVTVVGYPLGGDTISVTKGVVSRIEVTSYTEGSDLLGIQIDAAINSGNSGGPAFNDQGECIGVAFQVDRSDCAENIGYLIPSMVVLHFLNDFERNGKYIGFPSLGVLLQKLENPALRAYLRVESDEGVLVRRVEPTAAAYNVLKEGDVIVSFDDVRVGCEATVPFRSSERIALRYLISQKFAGDVIELGIIRAGSFMKVNVTLNPRVYLVPYYIDGGQPSYFVFAGLVFTHLTVPLIEKEGLESSESKLLATAGYTLAQFKGEQIVILSQVLVNEVNYGCEDMSNQQVLKLNGTRIKNIHHLSYLVDTCKNKHIVFEFEENHIFVMEKKAAIAASPLILKDNGIYTERSRDLLEPYVDPLGGNQSVDQGINVERPVKT